MSDQEDPIVWISTTVLPTFRALYGIIVVDIDADEIIMVHLVNMYNTYSFRGKKKIVLTTFNWLAGKNGFLGMAYIATGTSFILISILFALIHVKYPN